MTLSTSLRMAAWAAAGAAALSMCGLPAVASASVPGVDRGGWAQDRNDPGDWHHPEWGRGWNDGHPDRGWIPPRDWRPPNDWIPPAGWAPPPGWAPPADWVGPCDGPLNQLFHPLRCARF
jgi:hypothetical protein